MKRFNKLISAIVLICFIFNTTVSDYVFAMGPAPISAANSMQADRSERVKGDMLATAGRLFNEKGPGIELAGTIDSFNIKNFPSRFKYNPTGSKFGGHKEHGPAIITEGVALLDKDGFYSEYTEQFKPGTKFVKADYDNMPVAWENNPTLKETELISAFKSFRDNEAHIPAENLDIVEGWFETDEINGELPIARIEKVGRDKYVLVIHTAFVQRWNHIRKHDIWFEANLAHGERRTMSLAWGIFYRLAKHEMTDLKKRGRTPKGEGHVGYFRMKIASSIKRLEKSLIINKSESSTNEIGGRYNKYNDAMWLWFLGSYCCSNRTRYDNEIFEERMDYLLEDPELRKEFPLINGGNYSDPVKRKNDPDRKFATALDYTINHDFFNRPGIAVPNSYQVDSRFMREAKEREITRKKARITAKPMYAPGGWYGSGANVNKTIEAAEEGFIKLDSSTVNNTIEILKRSKGPEEQEAAIKACVMLIEASAGERKEEAIHNIALLEKIWNEKLADKSRLIKPVEKRVIIAITIMELGAGFGFIFTGHLTSGILCWTAGLGTFALLKRYINATRDFEKLEGLFKKAKRDLNKAATSEPEFNNFSYQLVEEAIRDITKPLRLKDKMAEAKFWVEKIIEFSNNNTKEAVNNITALQHTLKEELSSRPLKGSLQAPAFMVGALALYVSERLIISGSWLMGVPVMLLGALSLFMVFKTAINEEHFVTLEYYLEKAKGDLEKTVKSDGTHSGMQMLDQLTKRFKTEPWIVARELMDYKKATHKEAYDACLKSLMKLLDPYEVSELKILLGDDTVINAINIVRSILSFRALDVVSKNPDQFRNEIESKNWKELWNSRGVTAFIKETIPGRDYSIYPGLRRYFIEALITSYKDINSLKGFESVINNFNDWYNRSNKAEKSGANVKPNVQNNVATDDVVARFTNLRDGFVRMMTDELKALPNLNYKAREQYIDYWVEHIEELARDKEEAIKAIDNIEKTLADGYSGRRWLLKGWGVYVAGVAGILLILAGGAFSVIDHRWYRALFIVPGVSLIALAIKSIHERGNFNKLVDHLEKVKKDLRNNESLSAEKQLEEFIKLWAWKRREPIIKVSGDKDLSGIYNAVSDGSIIELDLKKSSHNTNSAFYKIGGKILQNTSEALKGEDFTGRVFMLYKGTISDKSGTASFWTIYCPDAIYTCKIPHRYNRNFYEPVSRPELSKYSWQGIGGKSWSSVTEEQVRSTIEIIEENGEVIPTQCQIIILAILNNIYSELFTKDVLGILNKSERFQTALKEAEDILGLSQKDVEGYFKKITAAQNEPSGDSAADVSGTFMDAGIAAPTLPTLLEVDAPTPLEVLSHPLNGFAEYFFKLNRVLTKEQPEEWRGIFKKAHKVAVEIVNQLESKPTIKDSKIYALFDDILSAILYRPKKNFVSKEAKISSYFHDLFSAISELNKCFEKLAPGLMQEQRDEWKNLMKKNIAVLTQFRENPALITSPSDNLISKIFGNERDGLLQGKNAGDNRGFDGLPNDEYTQWIRNEIETVGRFAAAEMSWRSFEQVDFRYLDTNSTVGENFPVSKQKIKLTKDQLKLLAKVAWEIVREAKDRKERSQLRRQLKDITIIFIRGQRAHYGLGYPQIYLDIDKLNLKDRALLKQEFRHDLIERNDVVQGLRERGLWEELKNKIGTLKGRSTELREAIEEQAQASHLRLLNREIQEISDKAGEAKSEEDWRTVERLNSAFIARLQYYTIARLTQKEREEVADLFNKRYALALQITGRNGARKFPISMSNANEARLNPTSRDRLYYHLAGLADYFLNLAHPPLGWRDILLKAQGIADKIADRLEGELTDNKDSKIYALFDELYYTIHKLNDYFIKVAPNLTQEQRDEWSKLREEKIKVIQQFSENPASIKSLTPSPIAEIEKKMDDVVKSFAKKNNKEIIQVDIGKEGMERDIDHALKSGDIVELNIEKLPLNPAKEDKKFYDISAAIMGKNFVDQNPVMKNALKAASEIVKNKNIKQRMFLVYYRKHCGNFEYDVALIIHYLDAIAGENPSTYKLQVTYHYRDNFAAAGNMSARLNKIDNPFDSSIEYKPWDYILPDIDTKNFKLGSTQEGKSPIDALGIIVSDESFPKGEFTLTEYIEAHNKQYEDPVSRSQAGRDLKELVVRKILECDATGNTYKYKLNKDWKKKAGNIAVTISAPEVLAKRLKKGDEDTKTAVIQLLNYEKVVTKEAFDIYFRKVAGILTGGEKHLLSAMFTWRFLYVDSFRDAAAKRQSGTLPGQGKGVKKAMPADIQSIKKAIIKILYGTNQETVIEIAKIVQRIQKRDLPHTPRVYPEDVKDFPSISKKLEGEYGREEGESLGMAGMKERQIKKRMPADMQSIIEAVSKILSRKPNDERLTELAEIIQRIQRRDLPLTAPRVYPEDVKDFPDISKKVEGEYGRAKGEQLGMAGIEEDQPKKLGHTREGKSPQDAVGLIAAEKSLREDWFTVMDYMEVFKLKYGHPISDDQARDDLETLAYQEKILLINDKGRPYRYKVNENALKTAKAILDRAVTPDMLNNSKNLDLNLLVNLIELVVKKMKAPKALDIVRGIYKRIKRDIKVYNTVGFEESLKPLSKKIAALEKKAAKPKQVNNVEKIGAELEVAALAKAAQEKTRIARAVSKIHSLREKEDAALIEFLNDAMVTLQNIKGERVAYQMKFRFGNRSEFKALKEPLDIKNMADLISLFDSSRVRDVIERKYSDMETAEINQNIHKIRKIEDPKLIKFLHEVLLDYWKFEGTPAQKVAEMEHKFGNRDEFRILKESPLGINNMSELYSFLSRASSIREFIKIKYEGIKSEEEKADAGGSLRYEDMIILGIVETPPDYYVPGLLPNIVYEPSKTAKEGLGIEARGVQSNSEISKEARLAGGMTASEMLAAIKRLNEESGKVNSIRFSGDLHVYKLNEALEELKSRDKNGDKRAYCFLNDLNSLLISRNGDLGTITIYILTKEEISRKLVDLRMTGEAAGKVKEDNDFPRVIANWTIEGVVEEEAKLLLNDYIGIDNMIKLLNNNPVEMIMPMDMGSSSIMNSRIDRINAHYRARAREKGEEERDIIIHTVYQGEDHLMSILSRDSAGPNVKRIVITNIKNDAEREKYLESFNKCKSSFSQKFRLMNLALPEGYSSMDEDNKTCHQARIIMTAIQAALVEKDDDIGKMNLKAMLDGYVDEDAGAGEYINNIVKSDEEWEGGIIGRLGYFLGKTVSFLSNLIKEFGLLKLRMKYFWTAA